VNIGTVPRILILGIKCRSAWEQNPWFPLDSRLGGQRVGLDIVMKSKISASGKKSNHDLVLLRPRPIQ